jgi:hypothetical protein
LRLSLVAVRFFTLRPYFLNTEPREIQISVTSAKNKGVLLKVFKRVLIIAIVFDVLFIFYTKMEKLK